jgi:hypothetical protein
MNFIRWIIVPILCGSFGSDAWAKMTPEQIKQLPPAADRPINFTKDIKPIVEASCIKCHGRGRDKGGLRMDTRETLLKGGDSGLVVVAGKSTESLLIELVQGFDPDNVMPRKGSRLTPQQVGLLRAWIDQGLRWDAGVTFAKLPPNNFTPRQPKLPAARAGLSNPVDRLLQAYFDQRQIKPAKPVDDRTFARRASLDVIGLLPPPEELDSFVADKRGDKRERLADRLLADNRRYAEHWLSFWNDMLRNDYRGTGYIDGGRKQISSWLFSALAKNLPYDQFVAQLVDPTRENEGFVRGIVWRGVVNASQTPQMQTAQNISQVFMGVNLKCASCHDSFINDWTLADAYGLANVYADSPLEMFLCDKPTGKKASVKFIYPELGEINADAPKAERQKRLAEIITQKNNGRLTRTIVNRLWAKFMGRGLVEPVDDLEQLAWNSDVLDWLAEDLAANGYNLKRTIKVILTSQAYQMPSVNLEEQKLGDYVFTGPAVRRLSAEQFRDALASLTGVWYSAPAAEVDFTAGDAEGQGTALTLPKAVQWIWSDANAAEKAKPETIYLRKTIMLAEVPDEALVVATCDNAYTLYVNGTKVVSGKDYQQPNFADIRCHLQEGKNLFAVMAVNHMPDNKAPTAEKPPTEAEANAAGFLFYARLRRGSEVLDFGTDSSWVWSTAKADGWEKPEFVAANWKPAAALGETAMEPWHLEKKLTQVMSVALVHGQVRSSLANADPLTVALGRPNREQVITSRSPTATTLQALELTNGETLGKVVQRGAEKLLAQKPASNAELVSRLYRQALGRRPTAEESQLADGLLGKPAQKEGVEDLLWAMSMLPEFQLIY